MSKNSDRDGESVGLPGTELRRYTLHIDFLAVDGLAASNQSEAYALALNQLRGEVDCYTATISPHDNWARASAVFCGVPGPGPADVCVDVAGHQGRHHGPGAPTTWPDATLIPRPRTAGPAGSTAS